ncbi:MAG: lytic transglycosylase domain-containing protein [Bacteroidales bacterium]|nr:lytic transglycosylase domain-containing protein [Bacteroidales bacterium]
MLGLKEYYFPIFEQILDSYQIPTELKYLAVIESALNPRAVSRVGATGMWQFMYGTGKFYNLNVNTFIDERRDPIAATHAAARFLKDLYRIYDDWILVIAAYNCGPGNVNKAFGVQEVKRIIGIFIIICQEKPEDMCLLLLQLPMLSISTKTTI